jgi:hypothetical protein
VILEAAGNVHGAAAAAAEALDRFERKGNVPMIERTRAQVARLGRGAEVG